MPSTVWCRRPSILGIRISISTTSGFCFRTHRITSCPSAATSGGKCHLPCGAGEHYQRSPPREGKRDLDYAGTDGVVNLPGQAVSLLCLRHVLRHIRILLKLLIGSLQLLVKWNVATLILDMLACSVVIYLLDFNYKGLLLLVFASVIAYVKDGKMKLAFVAMAISQQTGDCRWSSDRTRTGSGRNPPSPHKIP